MKTGPPFVSPCSCRHPLQAYSSGLRLLSGGTLGPSCFPTAAAEHIFPDQSSVTTAPGDLVLSSAFEGPRHTHGARACMYVHTNTYTHTCICTLAWPTAGEELYSSWRPWPFFGVVSLSQTLSLCSHPHGTCLRFCICVLGSVHAWPHKSSKCGFLCC